MHELIRIVEEEDIAPSDLGFSNAITIGLSGLTVGLIGVFYSFNPIMSASIGAIIGNSLKELISSIIRNPKVRPCWDAAITELEVRSREGAKMREDLAAKEGGFNEVVEEVLKQAVRDSEIKKQKHLGKMIARAAEDTDVPWELVHVLLKMSPSITYDEMKVLRIFALMGKNIGWRENDLKHLTSHQNLNIERLRNLSLLTPNGSGFEKLVCITEAGLAIDFLMALEEINLSDAEINSFDVINMVSDFKYDTFGVNINPAFEGRNGVEISGKINSKIIQEAHGYVQADEEIHKIRFFTNDGPENYLMEQGSQNSFRTTIPKREYSKLTIVLDVGDKNVNLDIPKSQ